MTDNSSSSQKDEIKELELSTNLNLSLCFLKLKEFEKVIKFASDALKIDPENSKGLLRRGTAHVALKHIDEARTDLEAASVKLPDDPSVKKELQKLRNLEKAHAEKERRAFAGMFDRAAREEEKTAN
jgi:peptidyl-prolyl isomerase D